MNHNSIKAVILDLMASILSGKATAEEIKRVIDLAKEADCLDFFKTELQSTRQILNQAR